MIKEIIKNIGYFLLKDYKPKEEERYEFKNYHLIVKPINGGN